LPHPTDAEWSAGEFFSITARTCTRFLDEHADIR